jgi:hypothetical protein
VSRTKIADLALENGPEIMKSIAEFAAKIKTTKGESLRIISGLQSIQVIADMKTLENFKQTLLAKDMIRYSSDPVAISLLFPPAA